MPDLDSARAKRWWRTGRRIGSIERAARFLDDVGFALLFPKRGIALPSLWEAASDRQLGDVAEDWGPDIERVWGWKDELPRRRLAWYGRFMRGRPSFLCPDLLADLYPRAGRPDDFEDAALGRDAKRMARVILRSGPTSTALLREAVGLEGKPGAARFSRALDELGRALVVTNYGTDDEGSGWPAAVLELTTRAFRPRPRGDGAARDRRAAGRFLATVLAARPADIAFAFGWKTLRAHAALHDLRTRGRARCEGALWRPTA